MSEQEPIVYKTPRDVDWEAIERDYRAGVLSLREISKKHGMAPSSGHAQIKRHADKADPPWERDLQAKVQAKAESIVRKRVLREDQLTAGRVLEPAIIEANAQAIATVRVAHRDDIGQARVLSSKLRQHLEHVAANPELYADLGVLMRRPDDKGLDKLNDIYMATIQLPAQVKMIKDLASAMDSLIGLEREAWSIGVDKEGGETGSLSRSLTDAERVTRLTNLLDTARSRAALLPPGEDAAA
jgi:hypothetical protein